MAYFKKQDYNKAEEIWRKAYQLYPSNPYLGMYFRVLSNVFIQQGFADAKAGNVNNAAYWFERASGIYPQDPEIWYNLGGAAFSLRDFSKAKMAFTKCLELNPNHAQAKNGLANCQNAPTVNVAPPSQSIIQGSTLLTTIDKNNLATVAPDESLEDPNKKLPIVLNGFYVLYNKARQKTKEGTFKDNRLMEGKKYLYDQNGFLLRTETYKNGFYAGDGR